MYQHNGSYNNCCNQQNDSYNNCCNQHNGSYNDYCDEQKHVHEITGSTAIISECGECHNHRFTTLSGEAVKAGATHVHEVKFRTDYADGHYHEFCGTSSPAIDVGGGKHVHYAKAYTDSEDGHCHKFQAASLIDEPLEFEC